MPRCIPGPLRFAALLCVAMLCSRAEAADERPYLASVRAFADNVLRYGRDTYGAKRTPLLVDGINVDTHEPAVWVLPDDCAATWKMPKRSVISNLASQQVLFRTLGALSAVTGDPKYRSVAAEATRYALKHLQYEDGLLYWGGHALIDLETEQVVGESHKDWTRGVPVPATWAVGAVHELKYHFPWYELMWEVDPEATRRFMLGFWAAHVQNWANLDMNRHGVYGRSAGHTWDAEFVGGPLPFTGKGLSFIHTGSDMMYAAALLHEFTGDGRPLTWGRRMASRYDDIRHPKTGLAADVYNYYRNERVLSQFGPEFGDRVTETSIASFYGGRYGHAAVCLLKVAERMGSEGDAFKRLALTDLVAFARHAYQPESNTFRAMLIDGTPLSPDDVKRPGGITPDAFGGKGAGAVHFWAYSLGALPGKEPLLWTTARSIARGLGLGELGDVPAAAPALNFETGRDDANLVFALLDLHRATGHDAYLQLARRIGDNILAGQFHNGFFVPSSRHLFCKFDTSAPLALLYLDAAIRKSDVKLPPYYAGISFFHCDYEDQRRTYDGEAIYSRTRQGRVPQPNEASE